MGSRKSNSPSKQPGGRVFVPYKFLSNTLKRGALIQPDVGLGVTMSLGQFRFRLKEKEISAEVLREGAFRLL